MIVIDNNPNILIKKGIIYIRPKIFKEFTGQKNSNAEDTLRRLSITRITGKNPENPKQKKYFYSILDIERKTSLKFELVKTNPQIICAKNTAKGEFFEKEGKCYSTLNYLIKTLGVKRNFAQKRFKKNNIESILEFVSLSKKVSFYNVNEIVQKNIFPNIRIEIMEMEGKKYLKATKPDFFYNYYEENGIKYVNIYYLMEKLDLSSSISTMLKKYKISYTEKENPQTKIKIRYYPLPEIRKKIKKYDKLLEIILKVPNYLEKIRKLYRLNPKITVLQWTVLNTLAFHKIQFDFWPHLTQIKKWLKIYDYKENSIRKAIYELSQKGLIIVKNPIPTYIEIEGKEKKIYMPNYKITQEGEKLLINNLQNINNHPKENLNEFLKEYLT